MVDLILAGAALAVLLAVTVVLVRGERPGPVRLVTGVAVIVLAAGTFGVALLHHQSGDDEPTVVLSFPALRGEPDPAMSFESGFGANLILRTTVPMGEGDKLPQGALRIDPVRVGADPYHGDLSLLCSTPGKTDNQQNCTGADKRVWSAEPLEKRATIAPAVGDPFRDPAGCDTAAYQPGYLELQAGQAYCVRSQADPTAVTALRVAAFPADTPLPVSLVVETRVMPER